MTALRLIVTARAVPRALVVATMFTLCSGVFGRYAFDIDLSMVNPPHTVPYAELFGLVTCVLAAALTRPRMWEWERIGGFRPRVVAAGTAVFGCLLPTLPVLASCIGLPADVAVSWLFANVLTLSGACLVLTALLGPALGSLAVLAGYAAIAVLDNTVAAAKPWLPLVAYPGPDGYWTTAVVCVLAAAVVHGLTGGSTAWARRLGRNE